MNLKEYYIKNAIPSMKEKFGYTNNLAVPKITKVIINVGLGKSAREEQFRNHIEKALTKMTGQKPIVTHARQSIAGFGIRKGLVIGLKVTLRGKKMYDFLTKLIHIALPRVRDFQGLNKKSLDNQGNLTIGLKEYSVFPETSGEDTTVIHGLEATIVSSAKTKKEAEALFSLLQFPFKK